MMPNEKLVDSIVIEKETETTQVEGTVLGQRVSAPKEYCPDILVRVPRSENREQYGIQDKKLPFKGFDVWNAYEVSCLTNNGLPVFCIAKIVYPCTNAYIVESKSLKLYLNSFNMMKYGDFISEAMQEMTSIIKKDLSKLLEVEVGVELSMKEDNVEIFKGYENVYDIDGVDIDDIIFDDYKENPSLLKLSPISKYTHKLMIPMLRSNCKITNQPDWGTAFIYINVPQINIDVESLLQYIVSFRGENHFHEEVCEMIYKRLYDILASGNGKKFDLAVTCIYTRRGGIDICPTRYNNLYLADANLISWSVNCRKLINQ